MLRPCAPRAPGLPVAAMLLATALTACATASDPGNSGGQGLPGTEGASCSGERPLFLSPDGRWLVYESVEGNPFAPVFVFIDVRHMQRRAAGLTAAAAKLAQEGRGPDLRGCWSRDSAVAYLPGHSVWFAADVRQNDLKLVPVKQPDCTRDDPGALELQNQVRQRTATSVQIENRDGRVLAEHWAQDAAADRIDARFLSRSPDGRFLSYVVTEYRGSFTAPTAGYVLQLSPTGRPPKLLGAPVFGAPVWGVGGDLYACTGRRDRSLPRIMRWSFARPVPGTDPGPLRPPASAAALPSAGPRGAVPPEAPTSIATNKSVLCASTPTYVVTFFMSGSLRCGSGASRR